MSSLSQNVYNYFSEFKVLKHVSRDFWLVNATNFFQCLAYFAMITTITLYLTGNVGFSDIESGKWVSFYTLFIVAFIFMVGPICDIIGIKKTMFIGLGFLTVAQAGLTFSPMYLSNSMMNFSLLGVSLIETSPMKISVMASLITLSMGTAFIGAPLNTALRRFTRREHRATGFNVYYLLMNIGAILANSILVECTRQIFGPIDANIIIMGIGLVSCVIAFICAYFINEHNYAEESERLEVAESRRPLALFRDVWKERSFQKLLLFLVITIGVRLVFTNQFLVMPKYYTRVLTEDFELGLANTINPIIIVTGLIAIIPIINKYSTMKLMLIGMSISALSLLIICIPPQWIMDLPFISTISGAYMFAIVSQIILFAIGELIFMPRFQEYIASIAPKDKVASYMALASLPMFIAKPINGFMSGILITYFCFDGIRAKIDSAVLSYWDSPEFMWFIYAVFAILSPLSVILLKNLFLDHSPATSSSESESEAAESA